MRIGTVKTRVSRKMFEALLNLPEGVEARHINYDFDTGSFLVRLEGKHLPITPHEDGDILNDPWVLPDYKDGKPWWPTLEKKQT